MKILYYSSHPHLSVGSPTGAGTHIREMINAMRELGHEVKPVIMGDLHSQSSLSAVSPSPSFFKSAVKKLIPGVVWRSLKEYRLMAFDRYAGAMLTDEIQQFKPDLVYERAAYMQLSGVKAAKENNCLHYMEINAPFIDEMQQFEKKSTVWMRKAKTAEKEQVSTPDKVYVVSSTLRDYYMQYLPASGQIHVMPNCVNTKAVSCKHFLKDTLIERHRLADKTIVGFVGSIFPYHGVDILIKAFAKLALLNSKLLLLIVGDGEIIPELKKLGDELGLKDQVIFTGSVNPREVFTYISLMDIAVMAKSNWYGSPVKLFEYGAMKKPIIAPLTKPVTDVMEKNIDGLLITPDEQSAGRALGTLLAHKPLRRLMGAAFHSKVMQKHTWQHAAKAILNSAQGVA